MNKYNHWLAKALKKNNSYWAITIGQTVYYSESKEFVDSKPAWIRHEECHKMQYKREGFFKIHL